MEERGTLPAMDASEIEPRSPAVVLLASILTCGLYQVYWYYRMYEELEALTGSTPTGNTYLLDLLLVVITCTLYGVWVDYKLSMQLVEAMRERGLQPPQDNPTMVVLLDVAAYVTGWLTNLVSTAVHQDLLNRMLAAGHAGPRWG